MKNKSVVNNSYILYKCPSCSSTENIPKDVVDFFDLMDDGDPSVPPRFACQKCSSQMNPVYYVNHMGIVYRS